MGQGVWDRMMRFLGFGPDEEAYDPEEAAALEEAAGGYARVRRVRAALAATAEDPYPAAGRTPGREREAGGNVVALPPGGARQPFRVLVVEPHSFDEVQSIADQLKNRRPVILNLEGLDKEEARQILNFLNGAVYALGGETQKVASGIFFLAPPGVDVASMRKAPEGLGGGAYDAQEVAAYLAGLYARDTHTQAGERPAGREQGGRRWGSSSF
ncbi:cell division protein SepF [Caldinitratiruptor microaerophilus]|uniref:Cell division protein SepF n=1 Tax=Caldinitratiruptor microaerophilus TaxID=671077 RepID=A0AA35G884_9FIRM|nr:cell division protein SepF [Caldinitratiruptor microaerophilus]BDG60740.1 hypothetical protein caldi_18300 [Caldinitratiruptor microaerophilus]